MKAHMVAGKAVSWHDAPREARNGAAKAVQYGERYGQRRTQKQSREKEAEGWQEQVENFYTGVAVGSGAVTANVNKAVHRQEDLMRAEPDDARNLAASVWSAADRA